MSAIPVCIVIGPGGPTVINVAELESYEGRDYKLADDKYMATLPEGKAANYENATLLEERKKPVGKKGSRTPKAACVKAGRDAFHDSLQNKTEVECPYEEGSRQETWWEQGWNAAEKEHQEALGVGKPQGDTATVESEGPEDDDVEDEDEEEAD